MTPVTAAIYCRVSTQEQEKGNGLEGQYAECRAYCDKRGYRVTRKYVDVESGMTLERPQFQRLLGAADGRAFQVVVVWRRDRFGRDVVHNTIVERALRQMGIRVEAITTGPQEDGPEAELANGMADLWARYEARVIAKRLHMGRRTAAGKGYWPAGKVPTGYRRSKDTKRLVPIEPDASRIREAFRAAAAGESLHALAKRMGSHHHTITGWLRNPAYLGFVVYDGMVAADAHPALTDAETWFAAQRQLAARCKQYRREPHPSRLPVSHQVATVPEVDQPGPDREGGEPGQAPSPA